MKTIALMSVALLSLFAQQETRLNGVYRIQFDKKYELEGYKISFKDSTYVKTMPDFVTSQGKIAYDKHTITIRKDKSENPIEISTLEVGKDTIKFATKSKSDLSLTINRGKMIRMKQ